MTTSAPHWAIHRSSRHRPAVIRLSPEPFVRRIHVHTHVNVICIHARVCMYHVLMRLCMRTLVVHQEAHSAQPQPVRRGASPCAAAVHVWQWAVLTILHTTQSSTVEVEMCLKLIGVLGTPIDGYLLARMLCEKKRFMASVPTPWRGPCRAQFVSVMLSQTSVCWVAALGRRSSFTQRRKRLNPSNAWRPTRCGAFGC